MSIANWQPATLYLSGALVKPTSVPPVSAPSIPNADFESGDTDWDKSTNVTIVNDGAVAFSGTWYAEFLGTSAISAGSVSTQTLIPVTPGNELTLKGVCDLGGGADSQAYLQLSFYTDLIPTLVSIETGELLTEGNDGEWKNVSITAVVPDGGFYVRVVATALSTTGTVRFDNLSWDYIESNVDTGLIFLATQVDSGLSGSEEPTWPTIVGNTVVDNEITWEAVESTTVTWEARPILKSGSTEPTWPTSVGSLVLDNTISWECVRLNIDDPNCPQTREVAIGASKIFAGDNDITRFSATLNPRDWTTTEDAGFLPTGQHQGEEVGVSAIGVYRGNLAVWSPSSFQVWQIDPDPAAMALLDAMDGIGSLHQKAVQPVSDDLFFLAALGVRTVGVAAASTNLASGDVGQPVDPLIQADVDDTVDPISTFYPSMGQYWLAFPPYTPSEPGETEPETDPPPDPETFNNCNEIWEIGEATPSLHVAGVVGGVWNGGVIIGTGILDDDRIDGIYLTNDTDDYDQWPGNAPGQVFYPDCQWYLYCGPLLYNQFAASTCEYTDGGWVKVASATAVTDTVGIDSSQANWSSTLTDNSVTERGGAFKFTASNSVSSTETWVIVSVFYKDATATNYTMFQLQQAYTGAGILYALFSQADGSISIMSTTDGLNPDARVRDCGDWWEVYLQVNAGDPAGNPGGLPGLEATMQYVHYPAHNADGTETLDVTATGSLRMGESRAYRDVEIYQVWAGALDPQIGSQPSSVLNKIEAWIQLVNHDDTQGGYYFEWRPMFNDSVLTRDHEILSLSEAPGLLYYDYIEKQIRSTDGTTVATVPLTLVEDTKYRLGVIFGDSKLVVGVDGVFGAEVPYDGSFPANTRIDICRDSEAVAYVREWRGYRTDFDATKAEVQLLMSGGGGGYVVEPPPEIALPYWDNIAGNGWIDFDLTTITTFFNTFGTTIEADDFEGIYAVGGSSSPIASLINTIDGGNRFEFIDDAAMTDAIMMIVDANGIVLDYVIYSNAPNSDFVTVPTGADYYLVTSSDTGNAKIKKTDTTNTTTEIDLAGSVTWDAFFGVPFGTAYINEFRIIPVEGQAISFTVPITSDKVAVLISTIDTNGIPTRRFGSISQKVLDFNADPKYIWGTGGGLIGLINNADYETSREKINLVPGQTYILNLKNETPSPANWIRVQINYLVIP